MKYFAIGDEDAVLGFGMVGVDGLAVESKAEAESAFSAALEDADVGIVIITERVADMLRSIVDQYLFKNRFPLIVEIPDRQGRVAGKPGIRDTVNAAIGINL